MSAVEYSPAPPPPPLRDESNAFRANLSGGAEVGGGGIKTHVDKEPSLSVRFPSGPELHWILYFGNSNKVLLLLFMDELLRFVRVQKHSV